jgi:hypothetical protein
MGLEDKIRKTPNTTLRVQKSDVERDADVKLHLPLLTKNTPFHRAGSPGVSER